MRRKVNVLDWKIGRGGSECARVEELTVQEISHWNTEPRPKSNYIFRFSLPCR